MNENRTTSHSLKVKYCYKYFGFAFLIIITFNYVSIKFYKFTSYNLHSVQGIYVHVITSGKQRVQNLYQLQG